MVALHVLGNNIFDILFFLQLLCLPLVFILSGLIILSIKTSIDCQKFLEEPILILILLIVIVILAGGMGFHRQSTWLLWVFFILMVVLIGFLFQFSISLWKFTKNGNDVGEAYKNWNKVKTCLQDAKVCDTTDKANLTMFQYDLRRTPYVQAGCCNPPQECGFIYKSPAVWDNTTSSGSTNPDCSTWSSFPGDVCLDCLTCKAGYLATLKKDWNTFALIGIICLVFLTVIYFMGCIYLFMNRKEE